MLSFQGVLNRAVARRYVITLPRQVATGAEVCGTSAGDVGGHPVWNLRAKTPQQEQATVPWHQVQSLPCSTLMAAVPTAPVSISMLKTADAVLV